MSHKRKAHSGPSRRPQQPDTPLRIIGGRLRGHAIRYDGNPATRPMKDRVREAAFNLIGPAVRDKLVVDLFSGTGAMGLEALSRGAFRAILIERRFPMVRLIEGSAADLGLTERVEVVPGDAFIWGGRFEPPSPQAWLVFFCPPFDFYVSRRSAMLTLCRRLIEVAPLGSLFVVESDERFDTGQLPEPDLWDVRRYPPSVIAVMGKTADR